jgi:hypothetical protein
MFEQSIATVGSLLILAAFVLVERGRLTPTSRTYLLFNSVGSVVLGVIAVSQQQWGFVLLEGVWAVVSIRALIMALGQRTSPRPPGLR